MSKLDRIMNIITEWVCGDKFMGPNELRPLIASILAEPDVIEIGGVGDIAIERKRQVNKEGWTSQHDDQHIDGSLAIVAAYYATRSANCFQVDWPDSWGNFYDKSDKHDRRRKLVIAGALIAAEIDRLDRAATAAIKEDK